MTSFNKQPKLSHFVLILKSCTHDYITSITSAATTKYYQGPLFLSNADRFGSHLIQDQIAVWGADDSLD